jgi:Fe-S cluster biogenesis protein NfuA
MAEQLLKDRVKDTLNEIRIMLQSHGGDVELVEVTDDAIVRIKLKGACAHCMGAIMTLKNVVEAKLRAAIPEIKAVERVD